jgi:ribosomal protein S18 acetylase RimI-like enzyme
MAANTPEGAVIMNVPRPAGKMMYASNQSSHHITALSKGDAVAAAALHQSMIPTSFLSSLGMTFSRRLYASLLASPHAFGYACKQPDGRMLGFIACTESTSRVYRSSLGRHGIWLAISLLPQLWRISVIRRCWETLRYPKEIGQDLPEAEVLCVAVSREAQGHGIGKQLMQAALDEFQRRGTREVKVAVGASNRTANQYYQHCGFDLAVTRLHHDRPMNIYTVQL